MPYSQGHAHMTFSKEVNSYPNHVGLYHVLASSVEFHRKRHCVQFYLNLKRPLSKGFVESKSIMQSKGKQELNLKISSC